jgi:WD40 repeat protein
MILRRRPTRPLFTAGAAFLTALTLAAEPGAGRRIIEITDPHYGSRLRQLFNPAGDEHNLYHYRSVFNADNSRFLGIETTKTSRDYRVTLYDGDGGLIKPLFTSAEYDWTLAWDRHDPRFFYTRKNGTVFRYDVQTGKAEELKTFTKPSIAGPSGLSLNQAGDRLLLRMGDNSVRSFRLPLLDDERVCRIEIPAGWVANWDKLRFTGYQDTFALTLEQKTPPPSGAATQRAQTRIYDGASGKLLHTLEGNVGHHDFSPDGQFAYVDFPFNQKEGMTVRVVNLDGTQNRVVFSAPSARLRHVRNYHLTWPAGVRDWFLLSFFPQTGRLPANYEPYLDEIVQVFVDGRSQILARTGTTCAEDFWAQPQQSASADGTRVVFNTNATCAVGRIGEQPSGSIDQCILYVK